MEPAYIEITFQEGIPIALNGEDIDGVTLIETSNKLCGELRHWTHRSHRELTRWH